jgi:GMP synthase (glutamine-hydrolysing)
MNRPLLIVLTGNTVPTVLERHGDFDAHFRAALGEAWGGPWSLVDARREDAPLPSPDEVAGILVSGSPSSVTEHAPWMLRLEAWLREVVTREAPLLGVCFGHQLLGSALGGEVRRNPRGRRIGTLRVRRTAEDPLLEGLPEEFEVNVSHQDHVAVTPLGVRMLVTAEHDALHAFAAGPRARAVQFHPEFHREIVRGYISERQEALRGEGQEPEALHASASETPHARRILHNFVRHFVRKG